MKWYFVKGPYSWSTDTKVLYDGRLSGPSGHLPSEDKYWRVKGSPHRIDGPAVESKRYKFWWVNFKCLSKFKKVY